QQREGDRLRVLGWEKEDERQRPDAHHARDVYLRRRRQRRPRQSAHRTREGRAVHDGQRFQTTGVQGGTSQRECIRPAPCTIVLTSPGVNEGFACSNKATTLAATGTVVLALKLRYRRRSNALPIGNGRAAVEEETKHVSARVRHIVPIVAATDVPGAGASRPEHILPGPGRRA